jgi:hypothetical protein
MPIDGLCQRIHQRWSARNHQHLHWLHDAQHIIACRQAGSLCTKINR